MVTHEERSPPFHDINFPMSMHQLEPRASPYSILLLHVLLLLVSNSTDPSASPYISSDIYLYNCLLLDRTTVICLAYSLKPKKSSNKILLKSKLFFYKIKVHFDNLKCVIFGSTFMCLYQEAFTAIPAYTDTIAHTFHTKFLDSITSAITVGQTVGTLRNRHEMLQVCLPDRQEGKKRQEQST